MKMLRCICNIRIDDNITDEKYAIIMKFLEEQYIETRIQLMEERMKK